jgi:hypothetical protein
MDGTLLPEPLIKVPVSSVGKRGMLGIDTYFTDMN